MIEYLKTAGQTAKKNGCTLINNKLVADFSAVKKFLDSSADELDKIGLTAEEVYNGFRAAAVEELQKSDLVNSGFVMLHFFAGKYRIYADFINGRKAVYIDYKRKYGVLTTAAARVTISIDDGYRSETALYIELSPYIYKSDLYMPITEINIA